MNTNILRPLFTRLLNREVVNPQPTKPLGLPDPSTGQPWTGNFTGQFLLTNPMGTSWNDLVQTGVLNFTENANAIVGGCDDITITANGSAINIPVGWKNIGSDAISTVNGDVNRILVWKRLNEVAYTCKVN